MITLCRAILIMATVVACGGAASAAEMSASGIFLVATEELLDPNFRETVVLVTQPQSGGPFGVIINRPLNHRLSEVFPEIEALKNKRDVVYSGGPVARQALVFLVRTSKPPLHATPVLRDVYITADPGQIDELLKRSGPTRGLRVYAGLSGWAPGQLQNEITRGGWRVLPADAETVFEKDPATIWPELNQRAALRKVRAVGGNDSNPR
jgi:putative transcriptional regulator